MTQTVRLADSLRFREHSTLQVRSSDRNLVQERNLVFIAAGLVNRTFGIDRGCTVELEKRIPVAAGLGGGSSDAASALSCLNRLWNLSASCAQLLQLAERLGSDVPFFLYGGTALVEGRGEKVIPLPEPKATWYLLVKPPIAVSTAAVYAELTGSDWSTGIITRQLARSISEGLAPRFGRNNLQNALFRLYPEAQKCFLAVQSVAPDTIVSGSGPTVVGSFSSSSEARAAQVQISHKHEEYWSEVVSGWQPEPGSMPCR